MFCCGNTTYTKKYTSILEKIMLDEPYVLQTDDIIIPSKSKLIHECGDKNPSWFHLYIDEQQSIKHLVSQMQKIERVLEARTDTPKNYKQATYICNDKNETVTNLLCKIKIIPSKINIIINGEVRNRDSNATLLKKYLVPGNIISMTIKYSSIWKMPGKSLYGALPKLVAITIKNPTPIENPMTIETDSLQPLLQDNIQITCTICFEPTTEHIAFVPCGHAQICKECLMKITDKKCPICRKKYQSILTIYLQ